MSDTDAQGIPEPEGHSQLIETDYEIGQDNIETSVGPFGLDIHNPVFLISGLSIMAFVFYALALPEQAESFFGWLRPAITSTFDGFFLTAANIFVLFCVFLIFSRFGSVRLGGADATPDYSYIGWFAMLFAAGMGIGLMFYGVSEPMSHFSSSLGGITEEGGVRTDWAPLGAAAGNEAEAIRLGMAATIFHWGLHPWAIYAVVALALALVQLQQGPAAHHPICLLPDLRRPGLGLDWACDRHAWRCLPRCLVWRPRSDSARHKPTRVSTCSSASRSGRRTEVILITAITAIALISVVRGLDGGVKILSEINMGLAALLLLFVLLVGPTLAILTGFGKSLLAYGEYLPALSNPFSREDDNFRQGWTAFYWAWWISWSPFVGMFIARVSRGRSVREFIIAVLLGAVAGLRAVDECIWWHRDPAIRAGRLHGGEGRGPSAAIVRNAQGAPAERDHLVRRHHPGDRLLRYLVGFRLAGDRHDHRRRQGRRAGAAAGVLVHLRRRRGDRAADRGRAHEPAGDGDFNRAAVHDRASVDVLGDLPRVAGRSTRNLNDKTPPAMYTRAGHANTGRQAAVFTSIL